MDKYLLDNWAEEEKLEKKAIRGGFGEGIVQIGELNKDVVVLNADLPGSLKLEKFIECFPDRYIQVGVAEQNMAGIATGFARYGKIPFITTFAAFSPGVNFSQIRLAAMSHLNFKIVGSHYGLNVGKDGASAQMNSDIAMMKALPGMTIINPADFNQAVQAVHALSAHEGMSYLRVTREKFPVFMEESGRFEIGKAQKLMDGSDVTIVATGSTVYESLMLGNKLFENGTSVDFLNMHTIKPLDIDSVIKSVEKTGKLVTIEEHNIIGGMGESLVSLVATRKPVHSLMLGVEDVFGESGTHADLWKKYGLDRNSLLDKVSAFLDS